MTHSDGTGYLWLYRRISLSPVCPAFFDSWRTSAKGSIDLAGGSSMSDTPQQSTPFIPHHSFHRTPLRSSEEPARLPHSVRQRSCVTSSCEVFFSENFFYFFPSPVEFLIFWWIRLCFFFVSGVFGIHTTAFIGELHFLILYTSFMFLPARVLCQKDVLGPQLPIFSTFWLIFPFVLPHIQYSFVHTWLWNIIVIRSRSQFKCCYVPDTRNLKFISRLESLLLATVRRHVPATISVWH